MERHSLHTSTYVSVGVIMQETTTTTTTTRIIIPMLQLLLDIAGSRVNWHKNNAKRHIHALFRLSSHMC